MKNYIFATDFSENAQSALIFAISYVQEMGGKLLLFHAYDPPEMYVEMPAYIYEQLLDQKREDAEAKLETLQASIEDHAPDLSCTRLVQQGPFVDALVELVKHQSFGGVIVGTKGYTGLKRAIIGSNTVKMLGKLSCPVFAIPEGYLHTGIQSIVYATDFQEDHESILQRLKELTTNLGADLTIMHVQAEEDEFDPDIYDWYQEVVREVLPEEKLSFHLVQDRSVQTGISSFVQENQPDLVVMAMKKKNWLKRFLEGSFSKRQVGHVQKPLMIIHPKVQESILK